jgi:N-acetylneuraminate synthase/N,N'-diacetyllegionaminate synthase
MVFKGKYGPLLIAEIGGNHEGDFEKAKAQTQLAIASGADVIKFQLYTGETLVSRLESADRHAHFKRFELSREQHIYLANMVQAAGLMYTASVWDLEMMAWIDSYIPFYKIGSGDLTAYPILKATAERGKPIVLSTGLSTEEEVLEAVAYIQSVDARYTSPSYLALLQCTSMYPIAASDAHLNVMGRLKALTGLTVGYSNHVEGSLALEVAAAMGASILEFHFTDTREGKQFRDHKLSLTCLEVQQLIQRIQQIVALQGGAIKQVLPIEAEQGHEISFRRAVYPRCDIAAGTVLRSEHLTVLRPNRGIDARDYDKICGLTTTEPLKKHQKLDWSMFRRT